MLVVIIFGFVSPTPKKRWMFVPWFFLVLAWTCWLYSTLGWNSDIDPLRTLIHICAWSILPAWIGFCCFAIGNIVIARVFSARKQPTLISEKVWLGLAAVLLALVTLSISVSTNTYVLIAFFFVISIPGILHGIHIIDSCIRRSKETNSWQTIRGPELIMWIVACFLGSAFLIHVLRPIPLGWDDLNVYMNIVKSISLWRSIPDNAGMVPWAVFLSSGYTLGWATQSFSSRQWWHFCQDWLCMSFSTTAGRVHFSLLPGAWYCLPHLWSNSWALSISRWIWQFCFSGS